MVNQDNHLTRRDALKVAASSTMVSALASGGRCEANVEETIVDDESNAVAEDAWAAGINRIWLGPDFWANPMEDWRQHDGWAECLTAGPNRNVHALTHVLTNPAAGFSMTVEVQQTAAGGNDEGAGFWIGCRSEIDEYRSNCFARNGISAGLRAGKLFLGPKHVQLPEKAKEPVELRLSGVADKEKLILTLEARPLRGGDALPDVVYAAVTWTTSIDSAKGNVALVSNFGRSDQGKADRRYTPKEEQSGSRYRFRRWHMQGEGFSQHPQRRFGPILWAMYSLSDSRSEEGFVLKLSALTPPMSDGLGQAAIDDDWFGIELSVERNGEWIALGEATLDPDAWVATFRVPQWDASVETPYRLSYRERRAGNGNAEEAIAAWQGTIQANPVDRPLRMAAMTCQNDYAFPYEPVATNVAKLKPDLVFFSGDQIYESHGGYGIMREPADKAIICYLRKFYQFGWAFREVMRNAPTLCLPDDHDVLQGNLWGEGGAPMRDPQRDPGASLLGGYVEPARVVNAVHRTNCAHHPDPFDPRPVDQGIGVYFGDMVYGGVGFAILADRQWKSDPERVAAVVGKAYSDEVNAKDFDQPGLVLLGERQEAFLRQWGEDWRGHTLKAVLSQTLFSCLSTHQPRPDRYLRFDFDSNSWPQTSRNRAIEILRTSKALHICGDTHLATLSQYGVGDQRDSNWAFCSPAIAAGWPRWWLPDQLNLPCTNRPKHELKHTGEYLDAFGNKTYVYAVGNPEVGKAANRYRKAHEKGSGFGMVIFDSARRTYKVEAFRFLIDALDGQATNQFPGWPVVIHQGENAGDNQLT